MILEAEPGTAACPTEPDQQTPASPAVNLSPLGRAVPVGDPAETNADDRDLVILSTPADEPPAVQSPLASDGAVEHAPQASTAASPRCSSAGPPGTAAPT